MKLEARKELERGRMEREEKDETGVRNDTNKIVGISVKKLEIHKNSHDLPMMIS